MNREKEVVEIYLDDIIPNRFQPRLTFDEAELNNLADSIREHGIIQPLVLRRLNNKYEIIAGERRYKASTIAGLTKVPAIVIDVDDNKSAELAIVENLQRKDLSAIEEAQSFKKLLDKGYLNQEGLAKKMGISQSTVANKLRLLNLTEEVQQALLNGKISERHARSLLSIKDPTDQVLMLHKIMNNRLTVKQTDLEIKRIFGNFSEPASVETTPIENISDFLEINKEEPKKYDLSKTKTNFNIDDLLQVENKEPISQKTSRFKDNKENIDELLIDKTFENQINPFQESDINIYENYNNKSNIDSEVNSLKDEINSKKTNRKDIISAINIARNTVKEIEKEGFVVKNEEFDFEDMYQIIIKIEK